MFIDSHQSASKLNNGHFAVHECSVTIALFENMSINSENLKNISMEKGKISHHQSAINKYLTIMRESSTSKNMFDRT